MKPKKLPIIIEQIPEGTFEFTENFLNFIYQGDMEGVQDLYAMTKYERAKEHIPKEILKEFESHLATAGKLMDDTTAKVQQLLDTINAAEKNGETKLVLDSIMVYADNKGLHITNVLPLNSPFFRDFKAGVEEQKQFCQQKTRQQKVNIVDDAVKQFLAEKEAKKAAEEVSENPAE